MKVLVIIFVLLAGCHSKHEPYVSPYGSPFGQRMSQENFEILRLHCMRVMYDDEKRKANFD